MYYFAYGSNMSTERIKKRCPGAYSMHTVCVRQYKLTFNKLGNDGSGKANIVRTGKHSDVVYGVLYYVPHTDVPALDRAEGEGTHYERKRFKVRSVLTNRRISCAVYTALRVSDKPLLPTPKYKQLILDGLAEFKLPAAYSADVAVLKTHTPVRKTYPLVRRTYTPVSNTYVRKTSTTPVTSATLYKRTPVATCALSRSNTTYDDVSEHGTVVEDYTLELAQQRQYDLGFEDDVIAEVLVLHSAEDWTRSYDAYADSLEIYTVRGQLIATYYERVDSFLY